MNIFCVSIRTGIERGSGSVAVGVLPWTKRGQAGNNRRVAEDGFRYRRIN